MRNFFAVFFVILIMSWLIERGALAHSPCQLSQEPIILGHFFPADIYDAKLSPSGSFFAAVDLDGNGLLWSLEEPSMPVLEVAPVPELGQYFDYVSFSDDSKYIIFDSQIINSNMPARGRIVVISLESFNYYYFDTYTLGGTTRSKFALSPTGLLAYVPLAKPRLISVVDLASQKQTMLSEPEGCGIGALAFDPSSKQLAIKDLCGNFVNIREIATGRLLKHLKLDIPMPDDDDSPDQSLFYWGNGSMLSVNSDQQEFATALSAETGHGQFDYVWLEPFAMFRSNNSRMLAICDITAAVNIEKLGDNTDYISQPFGFEIFSFAGAFSPRDDMFAVGSSTGIVALVSSQSFENICSDSLKEPHAFQQIVFNQQDSFISLTARYGLTRWHIGAR